MLLPKRLHDHALCRLSAKALHTGCLVHVGSVYDDGLLLDPWQHLRGVGHRVRICELCRNRMRFLHIRKALDRGDDLPILPAKLPALQGSDYVPILQGCLLVRMASLEGGLRQLHRFEDCLVFFVRKDELLAVPISHLLLRAETFQQRRQDAHQPRLIDEGQEHDRLPCETLAIQVEAEVHRVEIDERREGLLHELKKCCGDTGLLCAGRRQDTHQLLERLEGCTLLEVLHVATLQGGATDEVGGEGGVVIGIEPSPRLATLIVVDQYPAEAFDVGLADPLQEINQVVLLHFELLKIVPLLPMRPFTKPDRVGHRLAQILPIVQPISERRMELLVNQLPCEGLLLRLRNLHGTGLSLASPLRIRAPVSCPCPRATAIQAVEVHGEALRQELCMPSVRIRCLLHRRRRRRRSLWRWPSEVATHLPCGRVSGWLRTRTGGDTLTLPLLRLLLESILEDLIFDAAKVLEELLHLAQVDDSTICQVLLQAR
mmetsp:Transcript_15613/g.33182  ORF Transcript_15613/g.33182 Transcript_15613/m.33182 type:complete len:487 (+) Transcript_15613:452-1912(+)